jgi:hypothetical protein
MIIWQITHRLPFISSQHTVTPAVKNLDQGLTDTSEGAGD